VSLLSGIAHSRNLSIVPKDSISFAQKKRFFNAKNPWDICDSFTDGRSRKGFSDNPVCTHRNPG
jgi:hypothetical protein